MLGVGIGLAALILTVTNAHGEIQAVRGDMGAEMQTMRAEMRVKEHCV